MDRITMKDLPSEDRPYERCLRMGPKVLSDAELLAIIIRTGSREATSLELAQKILALNYPQEGILGLLHHSLKELTQIKGIGRVKSAQLLCIGELSRRIWKQAVSNKSRSFHAPAAIADYYMEDMRHLEQEEIRAMFLDTKQMLIRDMMVSRGTVNTSVISPREVLIEALRWQAVTMILIHNHPSGDPSPSREDILLTRRMREAGSLVGITLLDHVIIGDNAYTSLREQKLL